MPETTPQITLAEVSIEQDCVVLDLKAGRAENNRLASLGFTPGVAVSMVQNFGRGPLIVNVRGTRVALGRGEASHIIVSRGDHE